VTGCRSAIGMDVDRHVCTGIIEDLGPLLSLVIDKRILSGRLGLICIGARGSALLRTSA
jgi:hypothetical protein